eukprot:gene19765-23640_t
MDFVQGYNNFFAGSLDEFVTYDSSSFGEVLNESCPTSFTYWLNYLSYEAPLYSPNAIGEFYHDIPRVTYSNFTKFEYTMDEDDYWLGVLFAASFTFVIGVTTFLTIVVHTSFSLLNEEHNITIGVTIFSVMVVAASFVCCLLGFVAAYYGYAGTLDDAGSLKDTFNEIGDKLVEIETEFLTLDEDTVQLAIDCPFWNATNSLVHSRLMDLIDDVDSLADIFYLIADYIEAGEEVAVEYEDGTFYAIPFVLFVDIVLFLVIILVIAYKKWLRTQSRYDARPVTMHDQVRCTTSYDARPGTMHDQTMSSVTSAYGEIRRRDQFDSWVNCSSANLTFFSSIVDKCCSVTKLDDRITEVVEDVCDVLILADCPTINEVYHDLIGTSMCDGVFTETYNFVMSFGTATPKIAKAGVLMLSWVALGLLIVGTIAGSDYCDEADDNTVNFSYKWAKDFGTSEKTAVLVRELVRYYAYCPKL